MPWACWRSRRSCHAWSDGSPRRSTLGALVVAAIVLALFPAVPGIWLWFPLRFLLGAASEALFTLSETWVNQLSEERSRARSMATYVAALSVGFALGPLILSAVGSAGAPPYLIGAGPPWRQRS